MRRLILIAALLLATQPYHKRIPESEITDEHRALRVIYNRAIYTYNWAPGEGRYGASEYVIRAGANALIVANATPGEYCAPLQR